MADCVVDKQNWGVTQCTRLPQMTKCIITTPQNARFTAANIADPDYVQGKLVAPKGERWYLWPLFVDMEDQSEAAVRKQTALSTTKVRDGRYQFSFKIQQDMCTHKAMFTHRANSGRVILWDIENQLTFTQTGDDEYAGLSIQLLDTENIKISNGTDPSVSPIYLVLADSKEINQNGAIVDGSFVGALDRLTDVELTLGTLTDTDIIVTVTNKCDGTPINGLDAADFILLKTSDGSAQAKTFTEDDGTYTLHSGTAFVDGTIRLADPDDLTITAYEGTTLVTVNVP